MEYKKELDTIKAIVNSQTLSNDVKITAQNVFAKSIISSTQSKTTMECTLNGKLSPYVQEMLSKLS